MTLTEKLSEKIEFESRYVEKDGTTRFSVCDHYNWDRDFWSHRHTLIQAFKDRGYDVYVSVRWGVTDIDITKKITL